MSMGNPFLTRDMQAKPENADTIPLLFSLFQVIQKIKQSKKQVDQNPAKMPHYLYLKLSLDRPPVPGLLSSLYQSFGI